MRKTKRYTNTTFTRRVDHDGGRHHTARSMPEPAVCKTCGAIYIHRRWIIGDRLRKTDTVELMNKVHPTVCPACRQEATGEPRGFLYVTGEFLPKHHSDLVQLLCNEADRAAEDNPMARILELDEIDLDWIGVTTTTEHLAQRLGHALEKAYGGEVDYDFSHENKLARVTWHRD
jgi:predicted Zn-ribbon and HTH transcriptional regulator